MTARPTPASMRIAPASPDNLRAVAELHVASWQGAYVGIVPHDYLANLSVDRREESWRQVLAEGRSELLVAEDGASVLGFVSFGPSRDGDAPAGQGEIWALYVLPSAWSTGVGQALWSAARDRLLAAGFRSISLWVIAGNERAMRFYSAAGFSVEPNSEKAFEIGGAKVHEVRMVVEAASSPPIPAPHIRALAICLFLHEGRVLVNEAHDPVKGLSFCRPLGGGIEFGETGAQAVVREVREEIGAEVTDVRYVGTLENIFTYLGRPGHEIVLVYDARLVDVSLYQRGVVAGTESGGQPFVASWRPIGSFGPKLPLFPDGLVELLRSKALAHAV
jgi:ribosomal protein S18 acetylase RimI-like enzyme/ADP-ribose pyrophosphatase YjhB (NUDIX family)